MQVLTHPTALRPRRVRPPVAASDPSTDDGTIARRASTLLNSDPALTTEPIEIEVRNGVVWLSGTVDLPLQFRGAEHDVRAIPGVRRVHNHLQVAPEALAAAVRDAAALPLRLRGASPQLSAYGVPGGIVFLEGQVGSSAERDLAQGAARAVPGLRCLRSDISVSTP